MKYNVDDIVITQIRTGRARGYKAVYIDEMVEYGGKVTKILKENNGFYNIELDGVITYWSTDMLIPIVKLC